MNMKMSFAVVNFFFFKKSWKSENPLIKRCLLNESFYCSNPHFSNSTAYSLLRDRAVIVVTPALVQLHCRLCLFLLISCHLNYRRTFYSSLCYRTSIKMEKKTKPCSPFKETPGEIHPSAQSFSTTVPNVWGSLYRQEDDVYKTV